MSAGQRTGHRLRGLKAVLLAALVSGCTDSPFNLDWDHDIAAGVIVREDGVERVRVDEDGVVSGSLTTVLGGKSGLLEVTFLNEKGAVIVPADDEYMEVTVSFSDLATFEPTAPGAFSGRFLGLKEGQTSVYFKLKQGRVGSGTGHGSSPAIRLTISR